MPARRLPTPFSSASPSAHRIGGAENATDSRHPASGRPSAAELPRAAANAECGAVHGVGHGRLSGRIGVEVVAEEADWEWKIPNASPRDSLAVHTVDTELVSCGIGLDRLTGCEPQVVASMTTAVVSTCHSSPGSSNARKAQPQDPSSALRGREWELLRFRAHASPTTSCCRHGGFLGSTGGAHASVIGVGSGPKAARLEPAPEPMQQSFRTGGTVGHRLDGSGALQGHAPPVFFPSDWIGVQSAQQICLECMVSEQCLRYALANRITDGVWGGTSERQRSRLLRGRGPKMTIPGPGQRRSHRGN